MKQDSTKGQDWKQGGATIGIDLGDRHSRYCVLGKEGEILEEESVASTLAAADSAS